MDSRNSPKLEAYHLIPVRYFGPKNNKPLKESILQSLDIPENSECYKTEPYKNPEISKNKFSKFYSRNFLLKETFSKLFFKFLKVFVKLFFSNFHATFFCHFFKNFFSNFFLFFSRISFAGSDSSNTNETGTAPGWGCTDLLTYIF